MDTGRGDDRERVREANPIEDVVQDYFPLLPDGRQLKALCPFHTEKTPSFKVDPERGAYHCFGCHERGDVFSLVMKMEGVEFREALTQLAQRAGITLAPVTAGRSRIGGGREGNRTQAIELLSRASRWFQKQLGGVGGQGARQYLYSRGFTDDTIRHFTVGMAPPGWTGLADILRESEGNEGIALRLGLLKEARGGRRYDAFRGRITFPIRSLQGRVVGFGGRTFDDSGAQRDGPSERGTEDEAPKYLNSPESDLFRKGQLLYGLYEGREAIRRRRELLLMEGYTDVMMAHQAGFSWAVATLGTALTEDNVERVCRHADRVSLVFDGDEAGRRAARRAVELFLPRPVEVRVVILSGSADPCQILLDGGGREQFANILAEAGGAVEFILQDLVAGVGKETGEQRDRIARGFFPYLQKIPSEIRREEAIQQLAHAIRVAEPRVHADFRRFQKGKMARPSARKPVPEGAPLPRDEDAFLIGALANREQAWAFLALCSLEELGDPVLRSLTRRLQETEGRLTSLDLEDPREKSRFLELEEKLETIRHDRERSLRLLRDLLVDRLERRSREMRAALGERQGSGGLQGAERDERVAEWTEVRGEIARLRGSPEEDEDWESLLSLVRRYAADAGGKLSYQDTEGS